MFGLQNDLSMLGIVNTIHEHIDFLGVKMILHPCMAMRGTQCAAASHSYLGTATCLLSWSICKVNHALNLPGHLLKGMRSKLVKKQGCSCSVQGKNTMLLLHIYMLNVEWKMHAHAKDR